jgi:uncharacterized phage protein (TIGR02218 family)
MKSASTDLINLINSQTSYGRWECYTIELFGGTTLRYAACHFPIKLGSNTFSATGPLVGVNGSGGAGSSRAHYKIGLDVDTWNLAIKPRDRDPLTGAGFPDKIGTQPMLAAAIGGVFDAAKVTVERAYFAAGLPVYPVSRAGAVPVGSMVVFKGLVTTCDIQDGAILLTISDHRQLLTMQMPRNIYQAGCEHMLFDSGCKLNAADFQRDANVSTWSQMTRSQFAATVSYAVSGTSYDLGRVRAMSGDNTGFQITIREHDPIANRFYLLRPFPFPIAVGDSMRFWPGCSKTVGACTAFGNLINFGGDPYIPPAETTL